MPVRYIVSDKNNLAICVQERDEAHTVPSNPSKVPVVMVGAGTVAAAFVMAGILLAAAHQYSPARNSLLSRISAMVSWVNPFDPN